MKFSKISTDDPILTAYALGELEAKESAQVAAAIEHDIAAQQAIVEICATAEELHAALKDEPILERTGVLGSTNARGAAEGVDVPAQIAPVIRFPYYLVSGAAAAALIIFFALHPSTHLAFANTVSTPHAAEPVLVPAAQVDVKTSAASADSVALAGRMANVIPDGFSDLKPAPFRDAGYRLGKSIVSNDASSSTAKNADATSATSKLDKPGAELAADQASLTDASKLGTGPMESAREVAASYELVPVTLRDVPAIDSKSVKDQTPRQLLTLKIRYQPPFIDVNRQGNAPIVNSGTSFAVASKDLNFSGGLTGFGSLLKETPRAATYEDVLSWAPDTEKAEKADKRNEFIELVKKQKNATVE